MSESLLTFPTDFPIKIMGRRSDDFSQNILAIVLKHAPDFDAKTVEMRSSEKANYISLTCTIRAQSREQLDALYRELTAHPSVKMVL
jgi:putative lipoic acid-binding regulatory protein